MHDDAQCTATTVVTCVLAAALVACMAGASPVRAQSLLNGYYQPLMNEDQLERGPGPDQGDYAGLPVTPAAVMAARSWDPEELTQLEIQCRPHPSIYGFRGVGVLHVWEDLDPYTQQQVGLETWIAWQQQHRYIHMEPHPKHPPPWGRATWQGYSVGHWDNDVLVVHTDLVRAAWVRRNGLLTDDRATMDERFFRYGDVLTDIMMVSDPVYLAEPMVKSNEFRRIENGSMDPYPCSSANEIPRAAGIEPMHLPGSNPMADEWAVRNHVPLKAAQGGPETMYPEYQETVQKLPPNPPLSQIEQAEKKILAGDSSE